MAKTRSATTIANKERKAERRARRLLRAAERRLEPGQGKTSPERKAHNERRSVLHSRIIDKQFARKRKRNYKPSKDSKSPSELGERQFGNRAKGHHLHQKHNHLARALTPTEFQRIDAERKRANSLKERKQNSKMADELAFIHHAATGE